MRTILGSFRSVLMAVAVVGTLAFGAQSAFGGTAAASLQCTLPGPCGNCFEDCQIAGFPAGGECNDRDDCCLCFE